MEVDIIKRNESKLEVWFVSESLHALQNARYRSQSIISIPAHPIMQVKKV
jgi:hypothetical protein